MTVTPWCKSSPSRSRSHDPRQTCRVGRLSSPQMLKPPRAPTVRQLHRWGDAEPTRDPPPEILHDLAIWIPPLPQTWLTCANRGSRSAPPAELEALATRRRRWPTAASVRNVGREQRARCVQLRHHPEFLAPGSEVLPPDAVHCAQTATFGIAVPPELPAVGWRIRAISRSADD